MKHACESEETRTIDMTGYARFSMENGNGVAKINGGDGDILILKATKRVKADTEPEAREALELLRITVSEEKPLLSIRTDASGLPFGPNHGVSYEIRIPKRIAVSVEEQNGSVAVADLRNEVTVTTRNGSAQASRIEGRTVVRTTNGNVRLEDVTGQAEARTENGNAGAARVAGPTRIRTTNGNARLEAISGSAAAETHNGNVELKEVSGSASAITTNGNVRAALTGWEPGAAVRLHSRNGGVTLSLPGDASAKLTASSRTGRVQHSLALDATCQTRTRLEGLLGTGDGRIDLRTENGNVMLEKHP